MAQGDFPKSDETPEETMRRRQANDGEPTPPLVGTASLVLDVIFNVLGYGLGSMTNDKSDV